MWLKERSQNGLHCVWDYVQSSPLCANKSWSVHPQRTHLIADLTLTLCPGSCFCPGDRDQRRELHSLSPAGAAGDPLESGHTVDSRIGGRSDPPTAHCTWHSSLFWGTQRDRQVNCVKPFLGNITVYVSCLYTVNLHICFHSSIFSSYPHTFNVYIPVLQMNNPH